MTGTGESKTRRFRLQDRQSNQRLFASNSVFTTKYNLFTFFPKFFLEQFSKTSNSFFLVTSFLQQIEGLAPSNRYATMIGLGFVLSVSAAKEIWEDWRRRQADQTANHSLCRVLNDDDHNEWVKTRWSQVVVGDVVRVEKDEDAPADLVILHTSEPASLCYVETANIDGETNLKIRSGLFPDPTAHAECMAAMRAGRCECECELPNSRIDGFEGVLHFASGGTRSVSKENILIRGARLRNTNWLTGVVVYTGADTKIMQNTQDRTLKVTRMERIYNQQTVLLFCLLLVCIVANFMLCRRFELTDMRGHWYLAWLKVDWMDTKFTLYRFMVFCLLYHNFVPINLNITVEMVRLLLGHAISSDPLLKPADDASGPTVCRTSTLVEELGQVRYVFTDKTGTLTRNEMRLKYVCVGGRIIDCADSVDTDDNGTDTAKETDSDMFYYMLAVCHTVIVDRTTNAYQASSPDEAAIVTAARDHLKWTFVGRDQHHVYVSGPTGENLEFTVLKVLEFTSDRRRMSIVVRLNGCIYLFTKGADDVLIGRAAYHDESISMALDQFGRDGMRTLCFAYRHLEQEEYDRWSVDYERAQLAVNDRQSMINTVNDHLEQDWRVVGVTAVEDRLQEDVSETLTMLREAGMSVWMLTGDRPETALNIARSCGLLDDLNVVDLTRDGDHLFTGRYGILVDGCHIEQHCNDAVLQERLSRSDTVICCRTSPNQKAVLVNMVKQWNTGVCLAIGDGANDVSMIRAAHIGVGLAGREGVQAARSADFAISKFRMLQQLLLVHGCYSYQRLSKVFLYCMYKNLMLYAGQLWFAKECAFTGQTIYDGWFLSLYNIVFAAGAIVVLGVTEEYVQPQRLLAFPGLYRTGPAGRFFNRRSYWATAINSLFHSMIISVVVRSAFGASVVQSDNQPAGLWALGSTVFAVSVVTVTLKIFVIANYWTWWLMAVAVSGPLGWFLYCIAASWISTKYKRFLLIGGLPDSLFRAPVFWACMLLGPTLCLTRDFLWKFYKRSYTPLEYHIIQEMEQLERKAETARPAGVGSGVGGGKRQGDSGHGFAFSQTEGQVRLLTETAAFLEDPFRLISNFAADPLVG